MPPDQRADCSEVRGRCIKYQPLMMLSSSSWVYARRLIRWCCSASSRASSTRYAGFDSAMASRINSCTNVASKIGQNFIFCPIFVLSIGLFPLSSVFLTSKDAIYPPLKRRKRPQNPKISGLKEADFMRFCGLFEQLMRMC